MKRGCLFSAILLLLLVVSNPAYPVSLAASTSEQQQPQPVKTYVRTILPEIPEQVIKLNPPATQLVVNIRTGDIVVPCGNKQQVYTCVSGKPVKITSESETPMQQLWVQNPLHKMIQLTINVYEQSEILTPSETTESS
ncbi:hypothetical protein [Lyngbya sp. PCC 8106]|uniref:hypothetical protein n=1 Tax=Lyngbya sp. (strain PCC 8106) TaxID=313612 RepID=UPI0000EAA304|nr:hypothetical protein [Lyngbya sp. PCC 8106]EAW37031.1 hypothetical protein L8106_21492 [Lyngbya sp. PCC 8106]